MTAVEFLITELTKLNFDNINNESIILRIKPIYDEAKEMEKEQIQDAWDSGFEEMPFKNGEQYYNETFKSK